ncbi:MAG: lipoyl synthase [Gemmatimonadota bacterium]
MNGSKHTGGYAPAGKDSGVVKSKGTPRLPVLEGQEPLAHTARKPKWLKVRSPGGDNYRRLKKLMRGQHLHSVCEEAGCPNIGECWQSGTATFLILGDVCTRACKYCAIAHGMPTELDEDEPRRVAEAVAALELEHVVVTSVNRDELEDGGAHIFAETIRLSREARAGCTIEVLTPDFKGDEDAIRTVVEAKPDIFNHNLETVERLHPWARPGGRYWRSISFLGAVKRMDPDMLTKSGLMLGLGEQHDEIRQALADLRKAGVDIVTLGQYLRPSPQHAPVDRWVTPEEFAEWRRVGEEELGFKHVESGALVRSSYHAKSQARTVGAGGVGEITEVLEADVPAPAELRSGLATDDRRPTTDVGSSSGGDAGGVAGVRMYPGTLEHGLGAARQTPQKLVQIERRD